MLDCPDPVRRHRLAQRGMRPEEIDAAVHDAAALRRLALPLIPSTGTIPETAARIAAWVVGSVRD